MSYNSLMTPHNCELIALTGGPGAGKTAVLDMAKPGLADHIAILPEAAGIVFGGGFWRLDSASAKMASQRAIFHIQKEMEELVLREGKWSIGLCDRGTLDGAAYWPGSLDSFFEACATSKEREYARYKAVIHLRSPDMYQGYNYQNPLRIETAHEAKKLDEKIQAIWKDHPNYFEVPSSDSFEAKAQKALAKIFDLILEKEQA